MRALITGGAGFIGSHLAEALVLQGHDVIVFDDLSTGRLENIEHISALPGFRFVRGSAADDGAVTPLVEQVDAVFHLAAPAAIKPIVEAPIHAIHTNVAGTETVLKAAHQCRKRVLVASAAGVYGKGATVPFREDADLVSGPPDTTRWGYVAGKLRDEFLALGYAREHDLRVTVVRLFNTVGPRQSSRHGKVLPNFVRWALAGEPMTVHGDGSQTRSFTWVGDVVWAMMTLINEPRAAGQVFNVGNGEETSIRDLAQRVREMTASKSPFLYVPYEQAFDRGFEDRPRCVPDISKLRRLVGYEPRVHLGGIVDSVIRYWEEQGSPARAPAAGGRSPYAQVPLSASLARPA